MYQDVLDELHYGFIDHLRGKIIPHGERGKHEPRMSHEEHRIEERRITEFLATLAHELRGPLASMHTGMDLFEALLPDDPKLQELRRATHRQLRHMTRLIDDLEDASSVMAGKVVLKSERLDLRKIVSQALEFAAPLMTKGGHSVVTAIPDHPLYLEADPVRLTQLVSNLLTNAAKFTTGAARIELCLEVHEQQAVIIVRDNGIGIDPTMLPRLFDRYVQAEIRGDGSMGIGLPLVRRIAELHGGTVVASSAGLGRGSEFTVRLPLHASVDTEVGVRKVVSIADSENTANV